MFVNVRFDELMKDERLLSQEVDALDRRFDLWSLPSAAVDGVSHAVDGARNQRTAALPSTCDVTADLPPEVAAFEVDLFCHCSETVNVCSVGKLTAGNE